MVNVKGHFPGSCILHWDRPSNGNPGSDTGIALCSDTIGIAPDMDTVTFLWSYPNMVSVHRTPMLMVVLIVH